MTRIDAVLGRMLGDLLAGAGGLALDCDTSSSLEGSYSSSSDGSHDALLATDGSKLACDCTDCCRKAMWTVERR